MHKYANARQTNFAWSSWLTNWNWCKTLFCLAPCLVDFGAILFLLFLFILCAFRWTIYKQLKIITLRWYERMVFFCWLLARCWFVNSTSIVDHQYNGCVTLGCHFHSKNLSQRNKRNWNVSILICMKFLPNTWSKFEAIPMNRSIFILFYWSSSSKKSWKSEYGFVRVVVYEIVTS